LHTQKSFFVGQWLVDPGLNRISSGDEQVQLVPKVMALLLVLVEHKGEPLDQDKLIELVWPGQVVGDSSVYQAVAQLRKVLGDTGTKKTYIERVSGKGYRLIAPVAAQSDTVTSSIKRPWLLIGSAALFGLVLIFWLGFGSSNTPNGLEIDKISSITLVDLEHQSTTELVQLDALTHILLTQLMPIKGMKVIHHKSLPEVVTTEVIMIGKITRQANKVRVFLQMRQSVGGEVIWAQLFEGQDDDLFGLQDNIVDTLLALFKRTNPADSFETTDSRSFDQYLLAVHLWQQRSTASLQQARQIYEAMQQENSLFPLAAVGLCDTYHFLHIYVDWTLEQVLEKCQPLLEQALSVQPGLGQALAAKALLLSSQGHGDEAEKLFKKAVERAPNYAFGLMWYGNLIRDRGHYDDALKLNQRAYELSPMSPNINRSLAYSYLNLSQFSDARYYYQRALTLDPDYTLRSVQELDFLPLNVARANAFIQWSSHNPAQFMRRPYQQLTLVSISNINAIFNIDNMRSSPKACHFERLLMQKTS
jgi:DNA-binding winged helix-turn-helix (wHTH) protein/tetratricopeptide (TPR) repeat protein